MWCGEWGENNYEVIENTLQALDDPAAGFAGWCFWTWKKTMEPKKFPALNGIRPPANWISLMQGIGKTREQLKLTQENIVAAMQQFVAASEIKIV